jgi:hypothetical protein
MPVTDLQHCFSTAAESQHRHFHHHHLHLQHHRLHHLHHHHNNHHHRLHHHVMPAPPAVPLSGDAMSVRVSVLRGAACIWPFMYKLLKKYDAEMSGNGLEEGKTGKDATFHDVEVRRKANGLLL